MIDKMALMIADIDGTMVNEAREMMPITRQALEILKAHGVLLGIGSGRPIDRNMFGMYESYGLSGQFDVFIGMNGGQVMDVRTGMRQEYHLLKKEYIREIIEWMKPMDLNPFVYTGDDMICERMDPLMRASSLRNHASVRVAGDLSELWARDNNKLLFRVEHPERMPEIEKFAAAHPSEHYQYFKTNPGMIEFQDPRVSKGNGLESLCREMNIPLDEVMTFGDTSNDNTMLEAAGWGVCLRNGTADTRACADAVTEYTNEEDGMGRYLMDHWITPREWK